MRVSDQIAARVEEAGAPITPSDVRYIKLGPGGAWEASALDGDRLEWGAAGDPMGLGQAEDWDRARAHYRAQGRGAGVSTGYVRELRDFFTLDGDTLWITFARDHLWWTFATPQVIVRDGGQAGTGRAYRPTRMPWQNTDLLGRPLRIVDLSSRLTKVASYQQTMCGVEARNYLLRKINGLDDPLITTAKAQLHELSLTAAALIRQLHQADFELLADLVVTNAGWRRVSTLGGTMKANDLVIEQPATGERANVQVKSAADQRVLDGCLDAFATSGAERFFFICHTPKGRLEVPANLTSAVKIWSGETLARQALAGGLLDWLLARAA